MTEVVYQRPGREQPVLPTREVPYENPRARIEQPAPEKTAGDYTREGLLMTGTGMGAGASAWLARLLLRRMFPGTMPTTAALKRLNTAIQDADSSTDIKKMFGRYMSEVSKSDKPLTFADFIAQQPGHAKAAAVVKEMISNSGNIPNIEELLTARAAQSKSKVLEDIATALGVRPQSVVAGKDELIAARKAKAGPLYEEAFRDKTPIRDNRFFELFEAPAARKALREAMMNAENELKPIEVRSAVNPRRKDWWKRVNTTDIPEGLFIDDESSTGLRKYVASNLENADKIQQSLYAQMKAAMEKDAVTGYEKHTPTSRALESLHKRFMDVMYQQSPNDAYRVARDTYSGDSKILAAHQIGSKLLKMSPDEARKAIRNMTDEQREAVSSGFFGSLSDMNHQKFMRELVARPERYPERREVLSAVFRDPVKLDQFLANLRGEEMMADSAATYGNIAPSRDPGPRLPWLRVTEPISGGAVPSTSVRMLEHLGDWVGWPSRRASRKGTDILFREPAFHPRSVGHPDWGSVQDVPIGAGPMSKELGRWTGYGGLGGLGIYGASQMPANDPERGPVWLGQPAP